VSAVTDALDRMDFWSRELMFILHGGPPENESWPSTQDILYTRSGRIKTVVATSQFQAAQEAAREAQI
jgi:hypothetical protein